MCWRRSASRRSPPHANRHRPSAAQPGSAVRRPERGADRGQRPGLRRHHRGSIASPPSSTASAANPPPAGPPARPNRRTQPRAVVCGTPARAAAGRTPPAPPPTCSITAPTVSDRVQPTGQHERRQQRMGHRAPAAADPGHEDLPAPAPAARTDASTRTRTSSPCRTTGNPVAAPRPAARRRIRIDRQRARPYDGHGRDTASDPSRGQRPNCVGGVPRRQGQPILTGRLAHSEPAAAQTT